MAGTLFLAVPSGQLQPTEVITFNLETKMWNFLVAADLGLGKLLIDQRSNVVKPWAKIFIYWYVGPLVFKDVYCLSRDFELRCSTSLVNEQSKLEMQVLLIVFLQWCIELTCIGS